MAELTLVIGNKNYSSWSMRPWVALRQAGIPFQERLIGLSTEAFQREVPRLSGAARVPILLVDGEPVWDSLAICETAAELHPEARLWPEDRRVRQVARSICAEMHAGFAALRGAMPMNIRSSLPGKGHSEAALRDLARVTALWAETRARFGAGGDLLFGRFTIADAFYAPVVMRVATYAPPLSAEASRYCAAVQALPAVAEWCAAARAETEFVAEDEPYATAPA